MNRPGLLALLLCLAGLVACGGGGGGGGGGGKTDPPGSPDPGTSGGERITGNERLGWNQTASSTDELNRFRFVAYVDGTRVDLSGVECSASGGAYQCSSRMPSMTPGSHTIELASYIVDGAATLEGSRSAPLRVTVTGNIAGVDPQPSIASEQMTADGLRLRLDVVATGVDQVTALEFSEDGAIVVGERGGRVHVVTAQDLTRAAADAAPALDPERHVTELEVATIGATAGGLIDLALDPAFVQSRLVYALYTVSAPDGAPRFRLARYREVDGRLGERAVLVDDLPASAERPSGAIRFAPDGKLFVAFDDGGDPAAASRASSYSGKVLRLNPDGTTPRDAVAGAPVFAGEYHSPRGFDWHPSSAAFWIANASSAGVETLTMIDSGPRHPRVPARATLRLPQGSDVASIAFYRGALMPIFQGDLFAASAGNRQLVRIRFDRRDPTRVTATERIFPDVAGAINVVAPGVDGAVYLGTDRAVLRITPARAREPQGPQEP